MTKKAAVKAAGGKWLEWLKENVEFSDDTACNYMRLYEHREDAKFRTVRNITEAYRLLVGDGEEPEEESEIIPAAREAAALKMIGQAPIFKA